MDNKICPSTILTLHLFQQCFDFCTKWSKSF